MALLKAALDRLLPLERGSHKMLARATSILMDSGIELSNNDGLAAATRRRAAEGADSIHPNQTSLLHYSKMLIRLYAIQTVCQIRARTADLTDCGQRP